MNEPATKVTSKQIELKVLKLPTISQHGMKALEIINEDDLKMNDLESALSADPMLMGILLKYANSPMYRKFVEIKNVRKAINLLGVDIVKSAILICTMRSYCEPSNPTKEMLWEKSIKLSIMAKIIASGISRRLAEEVELSAMMSQIGGLVLSTNFQEEYSEVVESALENETTLEEQEERVFGVSRAEVTVYALEKLRLPSVIISTLSSFYQKDLLQNDAEETSKYVDVLKLARLLIELEDLSSFDGNVEVMSLIELLGLNIDKVDDFIAEYNEKMEEGFSF